MTRRPFLLALWCATIFLAFLGATGSIARIVSVIESGALSGRPVDLLSGLDRGSVVFISTLIGVERESAAYAEVEEQTRQFFGKFNRYPATTLLHVVPAALFMVLAPLQFSRTVRRRWMTWHRWSGRLIVVLAIPIGLAGLFFGLFVPFAGAVEATAIGLFGSWFLFAVIKAFTAIRRRDIPRHREWMIRMFAVAVGISVVRVVGVALALSLRQGPAAWFGQAVWLGFGATVAMGELWIRHTRAGSRVTTSPATAA